MLGNDLKIAADVGKCVEIKGGVPVENNLVISGHTVNGQYTYKRFVLKPSEIKVLDRQSCVVYQPAPESYKDKKLVKYVGTLKRFARPAPDIGYDYQIVLTEPVADKETASGLEQLVGFYIVVPGSDAVWEQIENNIGKGVEVEGYMTWGYAESKYLLVTKVTPK